MRHFLQHSLALSTRASYNSATCSFTHFALTYNRLHSDGSLLPASEETLMLFATYLSYSIKPQSIKVYLAAVRNMHIEHGLPNPIAVATQLRRLLRGIKRLHGCTTDSRLPITPTLLRSFRLFLNFTYTDHLTLWAAMLVAFFGFLSSNELIALLHSDLGSAETGSPLQGILASLREAFTHSLRGRHPVCSDGTRPPQSHSLCLERSTLPAPVRGRPHPPQAQPPDPGPHCPQWSPTRPLFLSLLQDRGRLHCGSRGYPRLEYPGPRQMGQRLLQALHMAAKRGDRLRRSSYGINATVNKVSNK